MRLLDMGINKINFSDSLLGILAQRLVRRLCSNCKIPYQASDDEISEMIDAYGKEYYPDEGLDIQGRPTLYRAGQCEVCNGTGYKGRLGIHEFMECTEDIKELIRRDATVPSIRQRAMQNGMRTMLQDGIKRSFKATPT